MKPQYRVVVVGGGAVGASVDALDADAGGYEPIRQSGRRVGEAAAVETSLTVHVVGAERAARVIAPSPHDPSGARLRA